MPKKRLPRRVIHMCVHGNGNGLKHEMAAKEWLHVCIAAGGLHLRQAFE